MLPTPQRWLTTSPWLFVLLTAGIRLAKGSSTTTSVPISGPWYLYEQSAKLEFKTKWMLEGLFVGDFSIRRFHARLDYQEHKANNNNNNNASESALFAIVARSSQGLLMFTVEVWLDADAGRSPMLRFVAGDREIYLRGEPSKRSSDGSLSSIDLWLDADRSAVIFNGRTTVLDVEIFRLPAVDDTNGELSEQEALRRLPPMAGRHDPWMTFRLGEFNGRSSMIGCVRVKNFGEKAEGYFVEESKEYSDNRLIDVSGDHSGVDWQSNSCFAEVNPTDMKHSSNEEEEDVNYSVELKENVTKADDTLLTSLANNLARIIVEPTEENFESKNQIKEEESEQEDQKEYDNSVQDQPLPKKSSYILCKPHQRTFCQNYRFCHRKPPQQQQQLQQNKDGEAQQQKQYIQRNASITTEATITTGEDDFECVCREGYGGRYCQFSLFPRSCADAIGATDRLPLDVSFVTRLDPDGSAPLPMTFAECQRDAASESWVTHVTHNFPPATAVRGHGVREANVSRYFPITYRLFSPAHLDALIRRSATCRQYVRYDCRGPDVALGLKYNRTWFESVRRPGHEINMLGEDADGEGDVSDYSALPSDVYEGFGCGANNDCTCDTTVVLETTQAEPQVVSDEAVFVNADHLAIGKVFLRRDQRGSVAESGEARLTLGTLECRGDAGQSSAVTMRSVGAALRTIRALRDAPDDGPPPVDEVMQLEFEFRTRQPEIDNIVDGGDDTLRLRLSLRSNELILIVSRPANDIPVDGGITDFPPPLPAPPDLQFVEVARLSVRLSESLYLSLADGVWHRVVVEMASGDVRLSLDGTAHSFEHVDAAPSVVDVSTFDYSVGASVESLLGGFVGCVRNFRVQNRLVDLHAHILTAHRQLAEVRGKSPAATSRFSEDIAEGCPDLCSAETDCQQGAECVENLANGSTSCRCRNEWLHFGNRCENNVNDGSDVALMDDQGYLKVSSDDNAAPVDALRAANVVFSLRTAEPRALLLYAHDQFDNFMQIHLANSREIVFTQTNGNVIQQCVVRSPPTTVFNNMRWLQFALLRSADGSVRLSVEGEQAAAAEVSCTLSGPHRWSAEPSDIYVLEAVGEGNVTILSDDDSESSIYDIILPPQPAGRVLTVEPYNVLFMGGVPRLRRQGGRAVRRGDLLRRRLRRWRKEVKYFRRLTLYTTTLPALRGCMRGLALAGTRIDMRKMSGDGSSGVLPNGETFWRPSCSEMNICQTNGCENGGHCAIDWPKLRRRRAGAANDARESDLGLVEYQRCECSSTSYEGESCADDVAVTFAGDASLVVDASDSPLNEPSATTHLVDAEAAVDAQAALRFSYTTTDGNWTRNAAVVPASMQLLTVYFNDGSEFYMSLLGNGSVVASLLRHAGDTVPQRSALFVADNYADGYRHFVQIVMRTTIWTITIDNAARHRWRPLTSAPDDYRLPIVRQAQLMFFGGEARELEDPSGVGPESVRELDDPRSPHGPKSLEGIEFEFDDDGEGGDGDAELASVASIGGRMRWTSATDEEDVGDLDTLLIPRKRVSTISRPIKRKSLSGHLSSEQIRNEVVNYADVKRSSGQRFRGCMSNIVIDFGGKDRTVLYRPLIVYLQPTADYLLSSTMRRRYRPPPPAGVFVRTDPADASPLRRSAGCGIFRASETPANSQPQPQSTPGSATSTVNAVEFPLWEAPLFAVPFADEEDADAESAKEAADLAANNGLGQSVFGDTSGFAWTVFIVVALLLLLLCCVSCCQCLARLYATEYRQLTAPRRRRPAFDADAESVAHAAAPLVVPPHSVDNFRLPAASAALPAAQLIEQKPVRRQPNVSETRPESFISTGSAPPYNQKQKKKEDGIYGGPSRPATADGPTKTNLEGVDVDSDAEEEDDVSWQQLKDGILPPLNINNNNGTTDEDEDEEAVMVEAFRERPPSIFLDDGRRQA